MGEIKKMTTKGGGESYWFWCEGCSTHHRFVTKADPAEPKVEWTFDGDMERPTFAPSLLCNSKADEKDLHPHTNSHRCHLFLRAGQVQYLSDCTHELAGKTVPVRPPCF